MDSSSASGQPEGPRFIGYEASNQLTVKLRDIKRVGTSLDAMVAAGATNISGPTFSIDDRDNKPDFAEPMNVMGGIKSCSASSFLDALTGDDLERLGWVRRSNNAVVPALLEPMLDEIGFFDQGN